MKTDKDRWVHGEFAVDLETAYSCVLYQQQGMLRTLRWDQIPEHWEDQFCVQEQLVARMWKLAR